MTCKCSSANRLARKEAADYIRRRKVTLDKWARTGKNLKYTIVGRVAYYDIADLDAFLKKQQTF